MSHIIKTRWTDMRARRMLAAMEALVVLVLFALLAVLAPRYGVDSRRLDDRR